jgi:hypothetical protein
MVPKEEGDPAQLKQRWTVLMQGVHRQPLRGGLGHAHFSVDQLYIYNVFTSIAGSILSGSLLTAYIVAMCWGHGGSNSNTGSGAIENANKDTDNFHHGRRWSHKHLK